MVDPLDVEFRPDWLHLILILIPLSARSPSAVVIGRKLLFELILFVKDLCDEGFVAVSEEGVIFVPRARCGFGSIVLLLPTGVVVLWMPVEDPEEEWPMDFGCWLPELFISTGQRVLASGSASRSMTSLPTPRSRSQSSVSEELWRSLRPPPPPPPTPPPRFQHARPQSCTAEAPLSADDDAALETFNDDDDNVDCDDDNDNCDDDESEVVAATTTTLLLPVQLAFFIRHSRT